MITTQLINYNPYTHSSGLASKLFGQTLPPVNVINTNDYCPVKCCYSEKVFAEVGGEWWKNDKNSFLFRKWVAADTIEFQIWKNGEQI